jgi:hypothetical protein
MVFSFFKCVLETGSAFAIGYKKGKLPAQLGPSDSTIDHWSSGTGSISVGNTSAFHHLIESIIIITTTTIITANGFLPGGNLISEPSCLNKLKMIDNV